MEILRIGDKIVDVERGAEAVADILRLRAEGRTQREVAGRFGLERSAISHIESLGELRRGRRVAIIGFPIGNKAAVEELSRKHGVDFTYLLSEEDRLKFAKQRGGAEIFNETLRVIGELKRYDVVIFIGSDFRIGEIERILEGDVVSLPLGPSPLTSDRDVDLKALEDILTKLEKREVGTRAGGRKRIARLFKA